MLVETRQAAVASWCVRFSSDDCLSNWGRSREGQLVGSLVYIQIFGVEKYEQEIRHFVNDYVRLEVEKRLNAVL